MTLYLGLDVQSDVSSFSLLTSDRADKPQNGRVNLDGFPKLLEDAAPSFLACEFTGRLAIPYARLAQAAGMKVYFLDTVSRSAYTRLFGQTSKTDKQDAKTIAQVFRRWAEHESEYQMRPHLFLDADMVEDAWTLRAMLFELRKLRQFQTSCELKTPDRRQDAAPRCRQPLDGDRQEPCRWMLPRRKSKPLPSKQFPERNAELGADHPRHRRHPRPLDRRHHCTPSSRFERRTTKPSRYIGHEPPAE